VLFENLRKAVRYYLAAKVGLVTSSLVAVLAHLPLPFAPVQIIILELFMDLCASTTFTVEPAEGDVMARPPRDPRRRFMDSSMVLGMLAGGLSLAAAVLVPYTWALRHGPDLVTARSAAVAAWLIGHVVLALHMRSEREPLTVRGLRLTLPFAVWAASAAALAAGGALTPLISRRLYLVPLPADMWGVVLASAILLPSWWEAAKIGRWRLRPQRRIQR
jgi:Ca2+-transporting ATPase